MGKSEPTLVNKFSVGWRWVSLVCLLGRLILLWRPGRTRPRIEGRQFKAHGLPRLENPEFLLFADCQEPDRDEQDHNERDYKECAP